MCLWDGHQSPLILIHSGATFGILAIIQKHVLCAGLLQCTENQKEKKKQILLFKSCTLFKAENSDTMWWLILLPAHMVDGSSGAKRDLFKCNMLHTHMCSYIVVTHILYGTYFHAIIVFFAFNSGFIHRSGMDVWLEVQTSLAYRPYFWPFPADAGLQHRFCLAFSIEHCVQSITATDSAFEPASAGKWSISPRIYYKSLFAARIGWKW